MREHLFITDIRAHIPVLLGIKKIYLRPRLQSPPPDAPQPRRTVETFLARDAKLRRSRVILSGSDLSRANKVLRRDLNLPATLATITGPPVPASCSPPKAPAFKCQHCNTMFASPSALQAHSRASHAVPPPAVKTEPLSPPRRPLPPPPQQEPDVAPPSSPSYRPASPSYRPTSPLLKPSSPELKPLPSTERSLRSKGKSASCVDILAEPDAKRAKMEDDVKVGK